MAGAYEAAYSEFTNRFDLNGLNLKDHYEVNRRMNGLDDFAFDTTPQKKDQNIYLDTLNSALTAYLGEKTKMQNGKAYDMSDVSIVDFVKEFDKVVNAIRTDAAPEGESYQHTPFAGLSESVMVSRAWKKVKHFNQPLGGIWGDQIRKGTLTLDDLQNFTSSSISLLDSMVQENRPYTDEVKNDLANVVMAKNAMAAAINKRSWTSWLNPLNWGSNRRENARLKELEGKLATYKAAGFPVDSVVPEQYGKNMLGEALSELQKTYGARNRQAQNTATAVKSEEKQTTQSNKETAAALYQDVNTVKAKFSEVIGDYTNETFKNLSTSMAHNLVNKYTDKCWDDFNAAKNEEQKQEVLAEYSKVIFKRMYNNVVQDLNRTKTVPEKLAMAQKLTDFAVNTYSPVAFDSKYAEFGDLYYLKNTDSETVTKDINFTGSSEDAVNEIDKAKSNLGIDNPKKNKETAAALYRDANTVKAKFSEVIGDYANETFKKLGASMANTVVDKCMDKCWDEFNAAKNEEQKQAVLAEHSKVIFKRMHTHVVQDLNSAKTESEKLAMAQKLTDLAMNTYSPVAFNSKYSDFGDVYYLKNTDSATVAKDIGLTGSPEDAVKDIDKAKSNLGIGNKETAAALYRDANTVKAKFSELMGGYAAHGIYKNLGASMANTVVGKCMDKCWDEFNAAKNEEQKQAVLDEHSKVVFVRMHTHVVQDLNNAKTESEKLAMAQKLTDFAMNTYSPVAFNSKYAKYGDNYFIQNADPVVASSDLSSIGSPDAVKKALAEASYELGKGKMSLPLDKEFSENPSKTSEKIQANNVPAKDKRLDI